jgi:hypothetical protein
MVRRIYTYEMICFLRENYKLFRLPELTQKFNDKFGENKTTSQIRACLHNNSITCGRKPGLLKGERCLLLSPEQVEFVKREYKKRSRQYLLEAINRKFGLSLKLKQLTSFVKNHNITCGRTGQYVKGNVPYNTGTKGQGICKPNSGSFLKGHVSGNTKPLGSERICSKDGFILVKVAENNPYTGARTRFKHKHVVVWEKNNGPVPQGMIVRLIDGDPTNCEPENLLLVTRAEHLRLNQLGLASYPEELKPTVVAIAKLEVTTFARARKTLRSEQCQEI